MQSKKSGDNWVLCFSAGDDVLVELEAFCSAQTIKGGFFNGLGALSEAELAFYDLPAKVYRTKTWQQPLELLHLTGSIGYSENKPLVHAHASVADASYQVFGGHLAKAIVGVTVELFVQPTEPLSKALDEEVGLKLFTFGLLAKGEES